MVTDGLKLDQNVSVVNLDTQALLYMSEKKTFHSPLSSRRPQPVLVTHIINYKKCRETIL